MSGPMQQLNSKCHATDHSCPCLAQVDLWWPPARRERSSGLLLCSSHSLILFFTLRFQFTFLILCGLGPEGVGISGGKGYCLRLKVVSGLSGYLELLLSLQGLLWFSPGLQLDMLLLFSCQVMSYSLQPHGLQHTRLPCPSLSPVSSLKFLSIESMVLSNHPIVCCPFSFYLQSCPASGSFPVSWLSASDGSVGALASASILPMNIQG